MWALMKTLFVQAALVRVLGKSAASLLVFVPTAFVLSALGFKALAVMGVLAVPILIMLLVFGLPIFMVLIVGGILVSAVMAALSFGLVVLKVAIPIAIVVWLVRWLLKRDGPSTPPVEPGHDPAI